MPMWTLIVLSVTYDIVFIIWDLINRPLLVPVNLLIVQLLTKGTAISLVLLTYLRGGAFVRTSGIEISIFPQILVVAVLIREVLLNHC